MGHLHYGGTSSFVFDDRTLTHLRTVILGKLGMQQSLVLTWVDGGAQRSIWLHPSVPIHFVFDAEVTPELNPAWIEQMQALANSPGGLRPIGEPTTPR